MIEEKISKKNKNSIVDIIFPNYNNDEFLEEALKSVINQTYKNWQLLIIDDNSQDNSKKIIRNYTDHDNINAVYLSKNKGVAFCRNLGIRLSNSEYISFLDSDDYWEKDKLEGQIHFMEKFHHGFTYSDYTPFVVKKNRKIFMKKINTPNSFNYEKFIKNTSIAMSSMIIRRSVIGATRYRKIKICEDYLFRCEILKKGNIANRFAQNTSFYRISKNSLQSNKLRNLYWVWYINKNYNRLSFLVNLKSIVFIIINSIRKYGIK